jgi:hypothetical protein
MREAEGGREGGMLLVYKDSNLEKSKFCFEVQVR